MASVTANTLSQISSMIPPEVKQQWNRIPHKNALAVGVIAGVGLAYFGYRYATSERASAPAQVKPQIPGNEPVGPAHSPALNAVEQQPEPQQALVEPATQTKVPQLDPAKISRLKAMSVSFRGSHETITRSVIGITYVRNKQNEEVPIFIEESRNQIGEITTLAANDFNTDLRLVSFDVCPSKPYGDKTESYYEGKPKRVIDQLRFYCEQPSYDHEKITEVLLKALIQNTAPEHEGRLLGYEVSNDLTYTRQTLRNIGFADFSTTPGNGWYVDSRTNLLHLPEEKRLSLLQEVAENPIGFPE